MEMDPEKRPGDAGELLSALRRHTDELPLSRLSGALPSESATDYDGPSRNAEPDSQQLPPI